MSSEHPFLIVSQVEFKYSNPQIRDFSYNSFLPELRYSKKWRSKITMKKRKNSLLFNITSSDITAFRAAISDIISLGKVIESSLELCK